MDDSIIRDPRKRYRRITHCPGESMTELSHSEAADINWIVNRFARTGSYPQPDKPAVYADVTNLQGALNERLAWAEVTISAARALEAQHKAAQEAAQASAEAPPATPVALPPS
jgi:hypothetical protein